jgi:hypothetical protein
MVCAAIALTAGYTTFLIARMAPHPRDFAQLWYGARVLIAGGDPYAVIGPGRAFDWPWPLYYPLPASLLALPFAPLPQAVAMGAFTFVGAAALAWALTERELAPLVAFLSICVWDALTAAQWSPLFAGTVAIAPLSIALIAKPNIGAALFVAKPSRWALWGAIVLLAVSFALRPAWVSGWLASLSGAREASGAKFPSVIPVTLPGGVLVLATLLRWRRPEARLIAALACVPQTMAPYESVFLFLVPRGWRQSLTLMALSNVAVWWMYRAPAVPSVSARMRLFGTAVLWCMYLPAALMVLLRPNEGMLWPWLEARITSWPAWVRGRSATSGPDSLPSPEERGTAHRL